MCWGINSGFAMQVLELGAVQLAYEYTPAKRKYHMSHHASPYGAMSVTAAMLIASSLTH